MIDKTKFSMNERAGEFCVTFDVKGTIYHHFKAENLDDAKAKVSRLLESDDFGCELDDVVEIKAGTVRPEKPMYRVLREGKAMQVTNLKDEDLPRDPDERGF